MHHGSMDGRNTSLHPVQNFKYLPPYMIWFVEKIRALHLIHLRNYNDL